MPIIERTPQECFRRFEEHVRWLISETLGSRPYVAALQVGDAAVLSFRDTNGPLGVPLETARGRLHFYMWQRLATEAEGRRNHRLTTKAYVYRFQDGPSRTEDNALIRFEYQSEPHELGYCRHHVQLAGHVEAGGMGALDMNKLHLPTGWVTIEEVLRFLIADLKVPAACGDGWDEVLKEGYRRFFEDYTSKRHKPKS